MSYRARLKRLLDRRRIAWIVRAADFPQGPKCPNRLTTPFEEIDARAQRGVRHSKERRKSVRRMNRIRMFSVLVVLTMAAVLTTGVSAAFAVAPPVVGGEDGTAFLCPAVGAGVLNHRPGAGVLPNTDGKYTFLPGHNQAGAHANPHSFNTLSPGETPGPGDGNSDWSPIWPPPTP